MRSDQISSPVSPSRMLATSSLRVAIKFCVPARASRRIRSHPPPQAGCPLGDPGPLAVLTRFVALQSVSSWTFSVRRELGSLRSLVRFHCFCQRAPRLFEQFIYPDPVCFSDSAILGFRITNRHRLGAQTAMFHQAFDGDAIDLGL